MDVEFDNRLMHLRCFGKADGFALHAFEMGAKVEVFAFDALGAVFADMVALGVQELGIALPSVGSQVPHSEVPHLASG